MPRLSIITINYNNFQGLQKTLDSVGCQTCKEFEHVIIDGGSTDGSKEIIEEYAKSASYNVNWVREKDCGIYNAMNKGIKRAKGQYGNYSICVVEKRHLQLYCRSMCL